MENHKIIHKESDINKLLITQDTDWKNSVGNNMYITRIVMQFNCGQNVPEQLLYSKRIGTKEKEFNEMFVKNNKFSKDVSFCVLECSVLSIENKYYDPHYLWPFATQWCRERLLNAEHGVYTNMLGRLGINAKILTMSTTPQICATCAHFRKTSVTNAKTQELRNKKFRQFYGIYYVNASNYLCEEITPERIKRHTDAIGGKIDMIIDMQSLQRLHDIAFSLNKVEWKSDGTIRCSCKSFHETGTHCPCTLAIQQINDTSNCLCRTSKKATKRKPQGLLNQSVMYKGCIGTVTRLQNDGYYKVVFSQWHVENWHKSKIQEHLRNDSVEDEMVVASKRRRIE